MKIRFAGYTLTGCIVAALAACGGSSGANSPTTTGDGATPSSTTLNGVVATGAALGGVAVTAYEPDGIACGSAVTKDDGTYSMTMRCKVPFVLEAQTAQGLLVAPWVSPTATANWMNITPLTTSLFFGSIAQSGTQSAILQAVASINQAQLDGYHAAITADLQALFPPSTYGVNWPDINLITTPFQANHTGIDLVLDNAGVSLPTVSDNRVTVTDTSTNQQFSIETPGAATPTVSNIQAPTPVASSVVAAGTTVQYQDFNYQQGLTSKPASTGSIIDAGTGANGSVTFGATTQKTATFVTTDSGYSWGSPLVYGNGFYSNANDLWLPAVAMLCQSVAGQGTGSKGQKSTDVFVPASAVQLTDASELIGVSFNRYYEDCLQGGTQPETTTGNYLSFDGQGNAHVTVSGQSLSVTAAQASGALTGTPLVALGGQSRSTVFAAFRYTTAYGLTRYVLVEHGSAGSLQSYVGVWVQ